MVGHNTMQIRLIHGVLRQFLAYILARAYRVCMSDDRWHKPETEENNCVADNYLLSQVDYALSFAFATMCDISRGSSHLYVFSDAFYILFGIGWQSMSILPNALYIKLLSLMYLLQYTILESPYFHLSKVAIA